MRGLDFSSWQSLFATLVGLALVTLIGVGIRMLMMITIQQRRERVNRQINERLRTLMAAYKALGGSFTGDLTVNPAHLRQLRAQGEAPAGLDLSVKPGAASDRTRRIRDSVEAALSDIILLGTEEQVRLAAHAAEALAAGRPVPTHDLVVSLRNFIRAALDLDPIPSTLAIPRQGPTRPSSGGGKGDGGKQDAKSGAGGGGMGMGGGGGMGGGAGIGTSAGPEGHDPADPDHRG